MPRLIHLNGPPGIGKSTLAQMYVDDHFGVLDLDIDKLRALVGGWQGHFAETGELVRPIAISMAAAHLGAGHDVVMPQYLGRLSEISRFEAVATDNGADFCEVVLMDSKERSIERFNKRGGGDGDPWHQQVRHVVASNGGSGLLGDMHDRLTEIIRARPNAVVIPGVDGAIQPTYEKLCAILDRLA